MEPFQKLLEIANNLVADEINFDQADLEIEKIKTDPPSYGRFLELLGFMTSAGAFSIILQTSFTSAIAASFIGGIIYFITLWAQSLGLYSQHT